MSGNPIIFDRPLLRARRRRALALGAETFLIDRVAADLAERLGAVLRQFDVAVDLGTPTDAVRSAVTGLTSIGTLIAANPGVTVAELAETMGIGPTYLYRLLPRMEREGRLRKEGRGYYVTS